MKNAVMYGAGNIGRGFIGQLFSLSGYRTTFIDINEEVVNRLRAEEQYPLYITKEDSYEKQEILNVTALLGKDPAAVGDLMATADIMATAVGVNVLPYIAKPLAEGVKRRFAAGNKTPLNIIICENLLGADAYLRKLVSEHLNGEETTYFNAYFGLVEASIGRMVPATPAELKAEHPLAVCVEEFCQLPVDRAAFKGEIPEIVNLQPFSPFEFFIQRKLFMHNMSHALTAYLGMLQGDEFIWQTAEKPQVMELAEKALAEASLALSKEHGVPLEELQAHAEDLLQRYKNKLLGDTCFRVGRDTPRKLSANDRLIGALNLCLKHGIEPRYICLGVAAALHFGPEGDEGSQKIAETAKTQGVAAALKEFSDFTDPVWVKVIEEYYEDLKK